MLFFVGSARRFFLWGLRALFVCLQRTAGLRRGRDARGVVDEAAAVGLLPDPRVGWGVGVHLERRGRRDRAPLLRGGGAVEAEEPASVACTYLIAKAAYKWREVEGDYRDDISAIVVYLPLFDD